MLKITTSSTVNRFWKSVHCWKQQWIMCRLQHCLEWVMQV